ncbi:MAG: DUF502 domain-containing protein [Planctomycetes bacterium]|nr:DUF502 domain-containing protein [Planctomycetota bacterium]
MSPPAGTRIPLRRSRIGATLRALFRTRVSTGLLVILPIYVTYWLVRFVFELMRDSSKWIVELVLRSRFGQPFIERWHVSLEDIERKLGHVPTPAEVVDSLPNSVQWGVAIFSVLLTLFLLYIIGLMTANIAGRRLLGLFEQVVDRVPLVKTVYRATKQILTAFSGEQSQNFQRVALIPLFSREVKSLGFVTNTFTEPSTGEEWCTVFYFTTPNPTTGYLLILKRSEITELDWSVEDAVRTLMSGGILLPQPISLAERKADAPRPGHSDQPSSASAH